MNNEQWTMDNEYGNLLLNIRKWKTSLIQYFWRPYQLLLMLNRWRRNFWKSGKKPVLWQPGVRIHHDHSRKRSSRSITSRSYSVGWQKSVYRVSVPAREQGTKMLKHGNQLWIYSPSTDRTIQISGHLLRQSVMGSDLSYEDMMDDRKLTDIYTVSVIGNGKLTKKNFVLELIAKGYRCGLSQAKNVGWQRALIPLEKELFAKSGQLLKRTTLSDVKQIQGRWFRRRLCTRICWKKAGNGIQDDKHKVQSGHPGLYFYEGGIWNQ